MVLQCARKELKKGMGRKDSPNDWEDREWRRRGGGEYREEIFSRDRCRYF